MISHPILDFVNFNNRPSLENRSKVDFIVGVRNIGMQVGLVTLLHDLILSTSINICKKIKLH